MAVQVDWVGFDSVNPIVISACPVTMIDVVWPKVLPHLLRPIDRSHGDCTVFETKKKLLSGNHLLILVSEGEKIIAAGTVEIRILDTGMKNLFINLLGGDRIDEWMDRFLEVTKAIARDYGCAELRCVSARKGWIKKLQPSGWKELYSILACPVGDYNE